MGRMEECVNESFSAACCPELDDSNMDDIIAKSHALNALLKELLEEKISTQKKHHWILGAEDLDETLVHDFEMEEEAA